MTTPLFARPIAHRGLHDRARGIIENSVAAFEAAIARDFAIECDLQLSREGVPVVFHDDARKRLQGVEGLVAETSAAEMTETPLTGSADGDCPLTLEAFLERIAGRVQLQIELKRQRDPEGTKTLARAAARALAAYKGPVVVMSFDPALIIAVREAGFSGPRGIILYDYAEGDDGPALTEEQRFILRNLLHWHETRFDFISCEKNALHLPAVGFWRALGLPVTAWTIRSPAEADAARAHSDQIVFEGFEP